LALRMLESALTLMGPEPSAVIAVKSTKE
jgi:hypothetical protein